MADLRPRIFISSTIYDFRDLRSALKYWLERLGYEVLLSEHNDFPVQADLNSYEACLRVVDGCDYFILLVGSRVGGWYDAANRVSITQAEYRRAYERLKAGGLKLIAFVRQDLWDVREDRRELERLLTGDALRSAELTAVEIGKITKHPSKFANDADFTFGFLNEIARAEEMKAATKGAAPFPVGNWIRQFTHFNEIIDALKIAFRVGDNLRSIALAANLRAEIVSNLRVLCYFREQDGAVVPNYEWASRARQSLQGGVDDTSDIKQKHLKWLGIFALTGCGAGRKLSTTALDEAITSGEFLEFDRQADAFKVGAVQDALLSLKRNIERLRHNEELMDTNARMQMALTFKELNGVQKVAVRNLQLIPVLAIHDSQSNVVNLSRAVHKAVGGDTTALEQLRLFGDSPLDRENATMNRERPTGDQIGQWIGK